MIRKEEPRDFDAVYALIKTAFETAPVSDGDEQDYAAGLRNGGRYIPELALVAELGDKLIGQVMLTKNYIETGAGKIECLLLGPVSVLAEHRSKGVGASLIDTALTAAKDLGYKAVFLCGDPTYYNRFGFVSVSNYPITPLMDVPVQYVLARELETGWLKNAQGTINIV